MFSDCCAMNQETAVGVVSHSQGLVTYKMWIKEMFMVLWCRYPSHVMHYYRVLWIHLTHLHCVITGEIWMLFIGFVFPRLRSHTGLKKGLSKLMPYLKTTLLVLKKITVYYVSNVKSRPLVTQYSIWITVTMVMR